MNKIFVSNLTVYRPSQDNPAELPKLEFCDPLFKRRLSQISRMTIQVVHDLIEKKPEAREAKLVFASFRGELSRQLKINKGLVEDAEVMPANFSISVFNTPPAAATIVNKIKAGYTAVYPSEDNFNDALIAAAAPVLCKSEEQILFVYADENIIDEYKSVYKSRHNEKPSEYPAPVAFACLLSLNNDSEGEAKEINLADRYPTPEAFLAAVL